jgi:cell division protein FtsA
MENGQLVVTCDLGTTTFRVLVTNVQPDGLHVLGSGIADAAGFRDGDFIDLSSGSRALEEAVHQAEISADVDITGFYYSIAGSHLHSLRACSQLQLEPVRRAVTETDVEKVMGRAHSIAIPFDHAILVANPVGFSVDGIGGIFDPVGRLGSQLEVEAHLITGSGTVQQNVEEAFSRIKREPVGWCVDILAASAVLLSDQEKENGAVLVDMGGASTQWVLFLSGEIAGFGMIPLGGRHLTDDLSHGLKVSGPEAQQIKETRGIALRSLTEAIDPEVLFAEEKPAESPGLIAAILEPRLEEIFAMVKKDIGSALQSNNLRAGIVLTGGGVRCEGTDELAEEVFQLRVETRLLPADIPGAEHLSGGQWATALGLATWAAGDRGVPEIQESEEVASGGLKGMFRKIIGRA